MGISVIDCSDGASIVTCTTLVQPGLLRLDAAVIRHPARAASRREHERRHFISPESGWSAASTGDGANEVQYDRQRRLLRAAGQEFLVPPAKMLVVLISDDDPSPVVTRIELVAAEFRYVELDFKQPKAALTTQAAAFVEDRSAAWDRALRQHPTIRAFLELGGWAGAT